MSQPNKNDSSRRQFIKTAGVAAATVPGAPLILNATNKSGSKPAIIGKGEFTYQCDHHWGQLPKDVHWGETHGVAVDSQGLVYVKHRNKAKTPVDAVVVFDEKGKAVHSFGKKYHRGGHGIDIRKEGNEEFLYLSATIHQRCDKTDLKGNVVWTKGRPKEPGVYDNPKTRYSPTNICFGQDGGYYIGDGYGSHYMHQYDKDDKWVRTWGGLGAAKGKMKTPHGQWLDARPGRKPSLVVADRANFRLQYFTLDGKHLGYVKDVSFPADIDIQGEVMMVSDLHARITLFDKNNKVIVHLGYDPKWTKHVLSNRFALRRNPKGWKDGKFIHPHDACFDKDGNIYVAEWVIGGRVSKLTKVS